MKVKITLYFIEYTEGGNYMYQSWAEKTMKRILKKLDHTVSEIGAGFPHVCRDGKYDDMTDKIQWWTNGFWPAILWLAYQQTGDEKFSKIAAEAEEKMDVVLDRFYDVDHDAGFMWFLSAGANYRITKNEESKLRCLKAASFLASRFNIKGNFIQAWNNHPGWAIVDCTMNIPLLYWASIITENPRYRHIAEAHAETVARHFVRPDGSVNHILSFDPETGELIESIGGQGSAPDSAWSRGASWAVYGLPLSYRYTKNPEFLEAAKRAAHFYLANLPEDYVAHWDFRVERTEKTPRDTSAAACGACGLLELAKHVPDNEKAFYRDAAYKILKSLTDNYSNLDNDEDQCIIREGTGHFPAGQNINVGLIYGDYFYIEGISRLMGNEKIFWYEP